MSRDLNQVIVSGRLGDDAQMQVLPDKARSLKFSLANRQYGGREGAGRVKWHTNWLRCQWITREAEQIKARLHKGRWLTVEGRIKVYQTDAMKEEGTPPQTVIEVFDVHFGPSTPSGGAAQE